MSKLRLGLVFAGVFVLLGVFIFLGLFRLGIAYGESPVKDAYVDHMNSIKVEEGVSGKNVIVFPIQGDERLKNNVILTLDEAMDKGGLIVSELEPEDVNRIMIRNNSKDWIFVMAGEILTGSKQDRILKDDLLLPPRSGKIIVSAYCVEHGRWTYETKTFTSNRSASNIAVRQKAKEYKDESNAQGMVWNAVSETQSKAGYASGTQKLDDTYKAPKVQQNIDELYSRFKSLPEAHKGMNGAVIVIGDEILCTDLFGKKELFRKLWPKLLKSYLLEAASRGDESPCDVSVKNVKRFISRITDSTIKSSEPPGEGVLLTIEGENVTGSALTYQKELLHTDAFPRSPGKKVIDDVPPIQRQY